MNCLPERITVFQIKARQFRSKGVCRMTTKKKKKHGRLKRTIRQTLGTLFLISAIVVAAIPADMLQASSTNLKISSSDEDIPYIDPSEPIYTTGDGRFQFAYVQPKNSTDKVAVIIGFDSTGELPNNLLTIPDTVEVYGKYTYNQGTRYGYVAVNANGNFLYYKVETNVTDDEGNIISTTVEFRPCYYNNIVIWGDIPKTELYYKLDDTVSDSDTSNFKQTMDAQDWRITNALVVYIGKQYVVEDENRTWHASREIISSENRNTDKAPFANAKNIVTLNVGSNLSGISDYAFMNCQNLQSVTLGNGLKVLGNHAFENCINMKQINLASTSNLEVIGDHAFYNCQGLTSFSLPTGVTQIGDYAFAGCTAMTTFNMAGTELSPNISLTQLGENVFNNCSSLEYLEFQERYPESIKASMFIGCSSLKHITLPNTGANVVVEAGDSFTWENFKGTVDETFYFEGYDNSNIHKTANENAIAFSYLDEDIYEIIMRDKDNPGAEAVFQVNSKETLIRCTISEGMENVEIPGTIGPYQIKNIDGSSFQDNCFLKKIIIPSSITSIAANAFKGCHELEHVIFRSPINITSIGENAFQTQDVLAHRNGCNNQTLDQDPALAFTGDISYDGVITEPYRYAMDPNSRINKGTQNVAYITYYSGWPTNLTVKYNETTDKNELINYPTLDTLLDYTNTITYPYMEGYTDAAANATNNYLSANGDVSGLTLNERRLIDAALNINLPEGIESVKSSLFADKEPADSNLLVGKDWSLSKTITTNSITEIPDNTFEGCVNLVSASINGATQKIGTYAFKNCENLKSVSITSTVSELGTRPFAGCPKLVTVDFQGSPYFISENAMIYGLTDGVKTSIVECLESRGGISGTSSTIEGEELKGITSLYEEAFAGCPDVGTINLESSSIVTIPKGAFRDTEALNTVYIPSTATSISAEAFQNSNIRSVYIPSRVGYIDQTAFDTDVSSPDSYHSITFYCKPGSNADIYAGMYSNILSVETSEPAVYKVVFMDPDGTYYGEPQEVLEGEDAVPPEDPVKEGKIFKGWEPSYTKIGKDTTCIAQYDDVDPNAEKFVVEFYDFNNELIKTEYVDQGADATDVAPKLSELEVEGYTFIGWRPPITEITADTKAYANYQQNGEEEFTVRFFDYNMTLLYTRTVKSGETVLEPKDPVREGYTFTGWLPTLGPITQNTDVVAQYKLNDSNNGGGDDNNGGGNGGDDNNGGGNGGGDNNGGGNGGDDNNGGGNGGDNNNGGNNDVKYYTLTVRNGSGSGSYVAGADVIVIANDPAEGQEFSNWTIDPSDAKIASKAVTATVITMPEGPVTVTANYAAKGTTTSTGSGNSSSNNSNNSSGSSGSGGSVTRPSNNGSGSTVVIDKNGLSNTGVVSATVNGSSDNFVIKITEDADATEKVVKALMNEYGDLTNIAYFPMDISLYDSAGNTKVTDTTGLSISITLPLPDSLVQYAGNNKVAGVVNEKLDKLTPKFSTINGVACVTFTAQHFSPYVIYTDTSNLTAGQISDNTPKTGDGIHPKWFLAIGLACISMVLFMKRDRRTIKVRKATA